MILRGPAIGLSGFALVAMGVGYTTLNSFRGITLFDLLTLKIEKPDDPS